MPLLCMIFCIGTCTAADHWIPDGDPNNTLAAKYKNKKLTMIGPKADETRHHWDDPHWVWVGRESIKWICNQSDKDIIKKNIAKGVHAPLGYSTADVKVEGVGDPNMKVYVNTEAETAVKITYDKPPGSSYNEDDDLYGQLDCISLNDAHNIIPYMDIWASNGPDDTKDIVNISPVTLSGPKLDFYAVLVRVEGKGTGQTSAYVFEDGITQEMADSAQIRTGNVSVKDGKIDVDISSFSDDSNSLSQYASPMREFDANGEDLLIPESKQLYAWQPFVALGKTVLPIDGLCHVNFIPTIEFTMHGVIYVQQSGAYDFPYPDTDSTSNARTFIDAVATLSTLAPSPAVIPATILKVASRASAAWNTWGKVQKVAKGAMLFIATQPSTGQNTQSTIGNQVEGAMSLGAKIEAVDDGDGRLFSAKHEAVQFGSKSDGILRNQERRTGTFGKPDTSSGGGGGGYTAEYKVPASITTYTLTDFDFTIDQYKANADETVQTKSSGAGEMRGKIAGTRRIHGFFGAPAEYVQSIWLSYNSPLIPDPYPADFLYVPVSYAATVGAAGTAHIKVKGVQYVAP